MGDYRPSYPLGYVPAQRATVSLFGDVKDQTPPLRIVPESLRARLCEPGEAAVDPLHPGSRIGMVCIPSATATGAGETPDYSGVHPPRPQVPGMRPGSQSYRLLALLRALGHPVDYVALDRMMPPPAGRRAVRALLKAGLVARREYLEERKPVSRVEFGLVERPWPPLPAGATPLSLTCGRPRTRRS